MSHFTRKAKQITATFQVHLSKGMSEHMRSNLNIPKPAHSLKPLKHVLQTSLMQRATPTKKQVHFIVFLRETVLVNILPDQLTHFWMDTYLPLSTTLPIDLDIGILNISQ